MQSSHCVYCYDCCQCFNSYLSYTPYLLKFHPDKASYWTGYKKNIRRPAASYWLASLYSTAGCRTVVWR